MESCFFGNHATSYFILRIANVSRLVIGQQHTDVSLYSENYQGIYDVFIPNWNLKNVIWKFRKTEYRKRYYEKQVLLLLRSKQVELLLYSHHLESASVSMLRVKQ